MVPTMANTQSLDFQGHKVYNTSREVPFNQLSIVGRGTVGTIEEVEGTSGEFRDRVYARKTILLSDFQDQEQGLTEIRKEVEILKQLRHLHIIKLVTTYAFRNNYAIIMDPLAERNLEQSLQKNTISPAWFGCLLSGLIYTHRSGVCHRDIKPQNILIKDGTVYLTDFGISKNGIGVTVPTTKPDQPRGRTPEYCAPEVQLAHTRHRTADTFSLGAVFVEMLTVWFFPEGLKKLRARLQTETGLSYGLKLSNVIQWIDELENQLPKTGWPPKILYLCRNMMQESHEQRPEANDLSLWWSHQQASDVPPTACPCAKSFDGVDGF
jgi:serine/threonine protein kinase